MMVQHFRRAVSLLLVAWCIATPALFSQYYDIKEDARPEGRFLSAGLLHQDFRPRPTNTLADSAAYRFTALMPMLAFYQGQLELYLGYTRFEERGSTRSAIVVGTQVTRDILLSGSPSGRFALPLMVAADYTRVSSGGLQRDDFNLASLGLGAGLNFRYGGPGLEFWIQGVQVFHIAFQGIATGTGSSLATVGETGLFLPGVPIGEGLVLSYRVRLQTWSLNDDRFNYRSLYHGPSIGILF